MTPKAIFLADLVRAKDRPPFWPETPVAMQVSITEISRQRYIVSVVGWSADHSFSKSNCVPVDLALLRHLIREWRAQHDFAEWKFFLQYEGRRTAHEITSHTRKLPDPPLKLRASEIGVLQRLHRGFTHYDSERIVRRLVDKGLIFDERKRRQRTRLNDGVFTEAGKQALDDQQSIDRKA